MKQKFTHKYQTVYSAAQSKRLRVNNFECYFESLGDIFNMASKLTTTETKKDEAIVSGDDEVVNKSDHESLSTTSDVFDVKAIDPVLSRKMALVNAAIDEIGMTNFQWKLFWLNGFGYAVDSVCTVKTCCCIYGTNADIL